MSERVMELERELASERAEKEKWHKAALGFEGKLWDLTTRCTVLEWLSVEDVLPETNESVLVIFGDEINHAWFAMGEFWLEEDYRNPIEVRHWCQLPKAPKL